jgi:hypothetical protein
MANTRQHHLARIILIAALLEFCAFGRRDVQADQREPPRMIGSDKACSSVHPYRIRLRTVCRLCLRA